MTARPRVSGRMDGWLAAGLVLLGALGACSGGSSAGKPTSAPHGTSVFIGPTARATGSTEPSVPTLAGGRTSAGQTLPGMPALLDPHDVWAADRPGALAPQVRGIAPRVYVPNTKSDTVTVIDPVTYQVLRTVRVGHEPQHVVPSWDLKTLWVNNDLGNSLTPVDARTGTFGRPVPVHDPYNLYFTPDGKYAVVMASNDRQLVFRDPHTMAVRKKLAVPCSGVNHADFSMDGRFFLVSCEFSGEMLQVDTASMTLRGVLRLPGSAMSMPQDVKLSTDGQVFFVADMARNGLWIIDAKTFSINSFLPTGAGAHGLYVTRDSKRLLVTNRGEGSISVVNMATRRPMTKWRIPGGGSPDMGGLSADGKVFWVAGRYNGVVYAISTVTGRLLRRITVGLGPHGLCIFPQPGRYSLGHTGVFR